MLKYLLVILLLAVPAHAQSTRVVTGVQIGGGGIYQFPAPQGMFIIENSIGRLESQGKLSGGLTIKPQANGGSSFGIEIRELIWLSPRVALTGSVRQDKFYSDKFEKTNTMPGAGIAIRDGWPGDMAGRLYIDFIIPYGCQWGAGCPTQSARLLGPYIKQEFRISDHFRYWFDFGVYHGLEQGNPLQPSAGRIGYITGESNIGIGYEFGNHKAGDVY